MTQNLTRRDFLNLASLLPLLSLNLPHFRGYPDTSLEGQNLPNIMILVFDALTAAQMSTYGYPRNTTPNISRFAERATVYHNHYSGGNFTSPGTASIFTGVYPWAHRAIHLHDTVLTDFAKKNIFSAFAEKGYHRSAYSHNLLVTSLLYQFREDLELFKPTRELCLVDDQFADLLFPNDYNAAFWSEWLFLRGGGIPPSSLFLSLAHRLFRNIHKREILDKYGDLFPRGVPNLHNLYFIMEDAINWIISGLKTMPQPFLAYYHLIPPHEPYLTRREFVGLFDDGWSPPEKPPSPMAKRIPDAQVNQNRIAYDEYLAYADAEFGRLYDSMLQNGTLENTIFIFTADHGELFERGIRGHVTTTLYQPIVHVPLLISRPGQTRREDVKTMTSCVDLLPTLLHLTGQEKPEWCEGEVLPNFVNGETGAERQVFAVEAKSNPKQGPLTKGTVAMITGQHKLVHYFGYEANQSIYEMYDLENDPEEIENIYSSSKLIAHELQERLDSKVKAINRQT